MKHSAAPDPPCICTSLRKANRAVSRCYDEALQPVGLTTVQFSLLRALERHGTLALSRLAALMVMDRTSLYRTLEPIERRGWVASTPASHGRTRVARLTASGAEVVVAAMPHWRAVQSRTLDKLGATQWARLSVMLAALEPASD